MPILGYGEDVLTLHALTNGLPVPTGSWGRAMLESANRLSRSRAPRWQGRWRDSPRMA